MHILHVIDTLRPGGAQRALVEIANQTCEAGITVSVCVTRDGLEMAGKLRAGIAVFTLERTRRFDIAAMRRLADWVDTHGVDVVHSHGRTTFSFLALLKTLRLIRRPLVMHDHTGRVEHGVSAPLWFRGWARKHVAHYVGVCAAMDDWAVCAGIPRERRSLIACALDLRGGWGCSALKTTDIGETAGGIDGGEGAAVGPLHNRPVLSQASPFCGAGQALAPVATPHAAAFPVAAFRGTSPLDPRNEFAVPPSVLAGICLGGVRPHKGIDALLAAVARSRRRGDFKIVVVGGAREQNYWNCCVREAKRLGLENDIVFAGERTDIQDWLGRFDFAVHAARSESGPLVVIEHLAAGLPLVCTRVGGIARRAEELGVEQFVPPDDPAALAAALDEVVAATPEERAARARQGKQIAHRYFDIRSVMPAWRGVYEKVSGKAFFPPNTAAA
jgi:glycosyltransferase involved in cell wall biosynthesis